MLSGSWEKLDGGEDGDTLAKRFSSRLPAMWRTGEPGASITFRFRGSQVGFFDIVGPDGGQLRVKLDDGEEKTVRRIDGYCTYHRLSKFLAGSSLDPEAVHTVTVTLDSAAPDKREILFERNRADLEKNPEEYSENRWNLGSILLIGDVVK